MAVFISTTAIFTSLPSASRAVRSEAEAAVQASDLDWTILRPTMIYGTIRDRNISRLLHYLKKWPLFPVCGNALWQPIHVADLARRRHQLHRYARHSIGHIYNVPGAEPMRFKELMRAVFQPGEYPTGQKGSDAEMDALAIEPHTICPQWNYTIRPRSPVRAPL